MAHQGQCSGQVSLNLANLDFQGLTRFLSQGLLSGFHSTSTSSFVREQTLNLHIVVYSHLSPSHLLLSMGTNSLDLLTNINLIENKGG